MRLFSVVFQQAVIGMSQSTEPVDLTMFFAFAVCFPLFSTQELLIV
jgi:hypothetical protein